MQEDHQVRPVTRRVEEGGEVDLGEESCDTPAALCVFLSTYSMKCCPIGSRCVLKYMYYSGLISVPLVCFHSSAIPVPCRPATQSSMEAMGSSHRQEVAPPPEGRPSSQHGSQPSPLLPGRLTAPGDIASDAHVEGHSQTRSRSGRSSPLVQPISTHSQSPREPRSSHDIQLTSPSGSYDRTLTGPLRAQAGLSSQTGVRANLQSPEAQGYPPLPTSPAPPPYKSPSPDSEQARLLQHLAPRQPQVGADRSAHGQKANSTTTPYTSGVVAPPTVTLTASQEERHEVGRTSVSPIQGEQRGDRTIANHLEQPSKQEASDSRSHSQRSQSPDLREIDELIAYHHSSESSFSSAHSGPKAPRRHSCLPISPSHVAREMNGTSDGQDHHYPRRRSLDRVIEASGSRLRGTGPAATVGLQPGEIRRHVVPPESAPVQGAAALRGHGNQGVPASPLHSNDADSDEHESPNYDTLDDVVPVALEIMASGSHGVKSAPPSAREDASGLSRPRPSSSTPGHARNVSNTVATHVESDGLKHALALTQ